MGKILLLSLANAGSLAIQLLAIVLVIVTRERPKPLLFAFWLSSLVFSFGISWIVLSVFRAKGTLLGSTSRSLGPAVYLIVGGVAIAAAAFAASRRGRELIGRESERLGKPNDPDAIDDSFGGRVRTRVAAARSTAEDALRRGSVWMAVVVGFAVATPTPYSLLAVGHMVRDGYSLPVQLLLILAFSLVTFIVVEVPVVSYLVAPESTASRVDSFATWLSAHTIEAVAALAAVVGIVMVVKGLTAM